MDMLGGEVRFAGGSVRLKSESAAAGQRGGYTEMSSRTHDPFPSSYNTDDPFGTDFRDPTGGPMQSEPTGWQRVREWFSHSVAWTVFRAIVKRSNYRTGLYGMVAALVLLLIVPIAMAAKGGNNLDSCMVDSRIPKWLQGTGVLFIITVLVDFLYRLNLHIRQRGEVEPRNAGHWFNFAVNMFLILWWIIGSAWVYPVSPWPRPCDLNDTTHAPATTLTTLTTLPVTTAAITPASVTTKPTPGPETTPGVTTAVAPTGGTGATTPATEATTTTTASATTGAAVEPGGKTDAPTTAAPTTKAATKARRRKREAPTTPKPTTTASSPTTTARTPGECCDYGLLWFSYYTLTFGWIAPILIAVVFGVYVFAFAAFNS